jgi:hypothetical protein
MLRRNPEVLKLCGFNDYVLPLLVFEAFYNLVFLNRSRCFVALRRAFQYLLVPDALTGLATDLMKADLALALRRYVEADAEGYERYL